MRIVLAVLAAAALLLGAWGVLRDYASVTERVEANAASGGRGVPTEAGTPSLKGRPSVEPVPPAPPVAAPPPPTEPAPVPGPAPSMAERAAALVAEIQRDVEPAAWLEEGGSKIKIQGDSLVVRADPHVQLMVAEYLEERRRTLAERNREGKAEEPGRAPGSEDPAAREAARREMRAILRRLHRAGLLLAEAMRAGRGGGGALLDASLALEPGSEAATRHLRYLARESPKEDREQLLKLLPWHTPLDAWPRWWASPETAARLRKVMSEAGLRAIALRGDERAAILERGSVTLRLGETTLGEALSTIMVETLVDLELDRRFLSSHAEELTLGPLDFVNRPLAHVLDELVGRVPDLGWRVTPLKIRITRRDLPDSPVTEIHGAADLLAEDPAVDSSLRLVGPDGSRGAGK